MNIDSKQGNRVGSDNSRSHFDSEANVNIAGTTSGTASMIYPQDEGDKLLEFDG